MALGATAGNVCGLVMARGLTIALSGAAVGTVAALAGSRLLSALLFEIDPADPVTFAGAAALMVGIAAIASFVPARWSMRIEPVVALRSDA